LRGRDARVRLDDDAQEQEVGESLATAGSVPTEETDELIEGPQHGGCGPALLLDAAADGNDLAERLLRGRLLRLGVLLRGLQPL
jgi:hypothetical protein